MNETQAGTQPQAKTQTGPQAETQAETRAEFEDVVIQVRSTTNPNDPHDQPQWLDYSRCTPTQARHFLAEQADASKWRPVDWIIMEPVQFAPGPAARTWTVSADVTATLHAQVQATTREEAARLAASGWVQDGSANDVADVAVYLIEADS